MFKKLSQTSKRFSYWDNEFEPPQKTLISDGDILIKQLSEKQQKKEVNLIQELTAKSKFYKCSEVFPVTALTSGAKSLEEFNSVLNYSEKIENLTTCGLENEEVKLLINHKSSNFKNKHKNLNGTILENKLQKIEEKMKEYKSYAKPNYESRKIEMSLSEKPNSVSTKLLKYALENEEKTQEKLPSAMDNIKDIEKKLRQDLTHLNVKKIRKKARSLSNRISELDKVLLTEPVIKTEKICSFVEKSKWDLKETSKEESPKSIKNYTCRPNNLYTIQNGQIIKLDQYKTNKKLSITEIKEIPKFQNYDKGSPSNILYIKNVHNSVTEEDLRKLLFNYDEKIESIKLMNGRMRGQVFINCIDKETAGVILENFNGLVVKNKPLIMQYGKLQES